MTSERSTIMLAIFSIFMLVLGGYVGIRNVQEHGQGQGMIMTIENLTQIKEDAYARGYVDGRTSIQADAENPYNPLIQPGSYSHYQINRPNASVMPKEVAESELEDTIILTGVTMSCDAYDGDGNNVSVNCVV